MIHLCILYKEVQYGNLKELVRFEEFGLHEGQSFAAQFIPRSIIHVRGGNQILAHIADCRNELVHILDAVFNSGRRPDLGKSAEQPAQTRVIRVCRLNILFNQTFNALF